MIILLKDDQKNSPPLVKVARFDKTTFMYTQIYTYIPEPKVLATTTSQLKSGEKGHLCHNKCLSNDIYSAYKTVKTIMAADKITTVSEKGILGTMSLFCPAT